MPRTGWSLAVLTVTWSVALNGASPANAQEKQTREFAVTIDGKAAGFNTMTISTDKLGRQIMSSQAKININYLLASYKYSYFGTEVWKDGRLQGFSSTSDDDGKRFTVTIVPDKNGLRVTFNKKERTTGPDVWLTTYWRLPDPKLLAKDGKVELVDADTGKQLAAKLQTVPGGKVAVAGKTCARYRLTGEVKADLWYDEQNRLARQEFDEDGHHVVLTLKAIK
ncbi:MAG: DUF6134 family protein [Gemmataceae bacterium]